MAKIGKTELIDLISEAAGESKATVKRVLEAFTEAVEDNLAEGNSITLVGFGSFECRHRQAREGVKPGTSEKIQIPASNYPAFKAGKALKEAVNP